MYFYFSPKLLTFYEAQTFLQIHTQERRRYSWQDDTKIYLCLLWRSYNDSLGTQKKKIEEAV